MQISYVTANWLRWDKYGKHLENGAKTPPPSFRGRLFSAHLPMREGGSLKLVQSNYPYFVSMTSFCSKGGGKQGQKLSVHYIDGPLHSDTFFIALIAKSFVYLGGSPVTYTFIILKLLVNGQFDYYFRIVA